MDRKKQHNNRLHGAICNNDIEKVRMYSKHVDLNRRCYVYSHSREMFPLELASQYGHEEIMEELLNAGADPNQVSLQQVTLSMMRCLISHGDDGADTLIRKNNGRTILHDLVRGRFKDTDDNILSAVKFLLENGASLCDAPDLYCEPLYEACKCGNIDLVKLFIDEGADVNSDFGFMRHGQTYLSGAADGCNIHLFDFLLNAGANRLLTPDDLYTPCEQNNHAMIARILDTCDVDINMPISSYTSILHGACANNLVTSETVRLLLDRGADVNIDNRNTALHFAAGRCDCNKIRQLLSFNSPLNIKNDKNQTPLACVIQSLICMYSQSRQQTNEHSQYSAMHQRSVGPLLSFKMLVIAGAKVTADVEDNLNQFQIKHPEAEMPDYKISCTRSLKEMCRFVIRGTIHVPVDVNLSKLPIPKLLQEYLNFPEFDSLADEYNISLKIMFCSVLGYSST